MMKGKRCLMSLVLTAFIIFFWGCSKKFDSSVPLTDRTPVISPDYINVTIPPNIAPMNFRIGEKGNSFLVRAKSGDNQIEIKSKNGIIRFPEKKWKKLLNGSIGDSVSFQVFAGDGRSIVQYETFYMKVADDPIDPYLTYRLINPGYYSWSNIKIMQRSLESFREEPVFDNQIMEKNCANCHSFNSNSSNRFLLHIRGSLGGTYFVENGKITRVDPKIESMPGGATYPSWHPDGRFVAFSSNQVRQSFYSVPEKNIEVFDLVSSLIIYDREKNEVVSVTDKDTTKYQQTFPSWSPDGRYLYFCRAPQIISFTDPTLDQIRNTRYDLARKSFDPETRTFGETEIVFSASSVNKSVSFPRVSPDGRFLVITVADYGTFPVWHREADLYMLDLQTGITEKMQVNSDMTESYHTWSANGRWLVFSSRRMDGRCGRPFFAYVDKDGKQGKEFALPQLDPELYDRMLESFNIPEFVDGRINIGPRDLAEASKQVSLKAKSGNPVDDVQAIIKTNQLEGIKDNQRSVHE
jgi:hypothetical protein